jgi:hypothetical protein
MSSGHAEPTIVTGKTRVLRLTIQINPNSWNCHKMERSERAPKVGAMCFSWRQTCGSRTRQIYRSARQGGNATACLEPSMGRQIRLREADRREADLRVSAVLEASSRVDARPGAPECFADFKSELREKIAALRGYALREPEAWRCQIKSRSQERRFVDLVRFTFAGFALPRTWSGPGSRTSTTLKGRTLESLSRRMEDWHRALRRNHAVDGGAWMGSPLPDVALDIAAARKFGHPARGSVVAAGSCSSPATDRFETMIWCCGLSWHRIARV